MGESQKGYIFKLSRQTILNIRSCQSSTNKQLLQISLTDNRYVQSAPTLVRNLHQLEQLYAFFIYYIVKTLSRRDNIYFTH